MVGKKLESIYTDVCGIMNIRARCGYQNFIIFTIATLFILMQHESEAFENFREFQAELEKHLGMYWVS